MGTQPGKMTTAKTLKKNKVGELTVPNFVLYRYNNEDCVLLERGKKLSSMEQCRDSRCIFKYIWTTTFLTFTF